MSKQRRKPYNVTTSYIIAVNGEYLEERNSLAMARKYIRHELPRLPLSSKIHIIKQVTSETIMDEIEYTMQPVLKVTNLDDSL